MFLNCHSYYSLRYGTMPVEKLVAEAVKNKIGAMAMTDINNSMGMMDFIAECRINGIKPIAGMEFRDEKNRLLFITIAKNSNGFREINEFLTAHNLLKSPIPPRAPRFDNVFVIYPFQNIPSPKPSENEFIGIRPEEINRLVISPYRHSQQHLVALLPVTFAGDDEYILHKHLRAIDNNTLLNMLLPEDMASPKEKFIPADFVSILYADYPQVLRNTKRILEECTVNIDFNTVKNKKTFTGSRYDDLLLLEKLACEGMEYRYGRSGKKALKRISNEMEIIDQMGFSAYFLIAWDIVRYSMSRGFYHVGRGSGANSIVAYCLKITDVDPIELDLYFERFINPKRTSPPDFDIDYSWNERKEVQDYIFKRYGNKHTALLGTITTFRDRSIFRELGKVYGLPKEEIDRIVENPSAMQRDEITDKIQVIGNRMIDFPNIRSIHAGGILISEEPITSYTALDLPPKGMPTTQIDMYTAGLIRLEKLDILSQRGIGHINESVDIIGRNQGIKVDIHRVSEFKKDSKVNERLFNGEAIGCFYIESPAMRGLLKKLCCNNYLSLVAASSIIRPGVAKSGMMREYIKRFHNPQGFTYLHPVMEEQLKETYGVMVYQEDVIKICHHFAGLDLSDADILRRAMTGGQFRSKGEFERIRDRFFINCREKGYPEKLTSEVWRQVASFAGYAFSKGHSASYAVESYQSLYLKTYFPKEFIVAVINNFGGFYHTWVYFNEARRCGANIQLPCVNKSEYKTCIYGSDVYIGLIHIANLESKIAENILQERGRNGKYSGLEDFVQRVAVTTEQLVILIRLDAFRFTGKTKKQLLWEARLMLTQKPEEDQVPRLFYEKSRKFILPDLEQTRLEDAYDEIELLGFPVTLTVFDMLQTSFRGGLLARELMWHVGKKVRILGNLVTTKYTQTVKKEAMYFGCFLDREGEFFDTVNFPDSLRQYPFRGHGVYLILGKVTEEFGFPSITVEKMAKLPFRKDPRY